MSAKLKAVAKIAADYSYRLPLTVFNKVRTTISDTEWTALKSGTTSFEGELLKGVIDWDSLLATPAPKLSPEEQSFLDNEVEELCAMVDDWKVRDELYDLPPEAWDYIKKKKFMGMIVPKEYGGLGFSALANSAVVAKLASRSTALAVSVMVPNSLGPAELLAHYGTKQQQDYYLPRLATGEEIPCFGLTSPQAGSDATNQKDTGVLFRDADGTIKIRLNWEKRYITLAPIATLIGLAFQLKDPENLLGKGEDLGITVALIPANTPGIKREFRHRPMAAPFYNGPNWGTDVVIPADSIIGGTDYAGKGWSMLVECLSVGRSISLPASSLGGARMAARTTGAYSLVRQQFGMPLAPMQGIQEPLARIAGLTYLLDSARMMPLQDLDLGRQAGHEPRPAVASAILKYHSTEMARQIALDAMDVHAGKGVVEGPNNPISAMYQTIPIGITVEGANILTRSLILSGQPLFLSHPYTMKELNCVETKDLKSAWKLAVKHTCYVFNNAARGFFFNLTGGKFSSTPRKGPDKKYYQHINRLSSALVVVANSAMAILQAALKKEQRTGALLGDALSHLYMASLTLRRWDMDGRKDSDRPLMEWACQNSLYKAEKALYECLDNFPVKPVGMLLKLTVFPRGCLLKPPSHRLDGKVAGLITTPGAVRDALTDGMFMPKGEKEYIARLEKAFVLAHEARQHESKIMRAAKKGELSQYEDYAALIEEAHAKGVVDDATADLLRRTHAARNDIIGVDCFPMSWKGKPLNPKGPIVP